MHCCDCISLIVFFAVLQDNLLRLGASQYGFEWDKVAKLVGRSQRECIERYDNLPKKSTKSTTDGNSSKKRKVEEGTSPSKKKAKQETPTKSKSGGNNSNKSSGSTSSSSSIKASGGRGSGSKCLTGGSAGRVCDSKTVVQSGNTYKVINEYYSCSTVWKSKEKVTTADWQRSVTAKVCFSQHILSVLFFNPKCICSIA